MTIELETEADVAGAPKRARRRARAVSEPAADPIARVREIVAAIKADREAAGLTPLPVVEGGERDELAEAAGRDDLVALLRQFLAAREHERAGWEAERARFKTELATAEELARKAVIEREEEADRHRHALADLTLQHEHQRSIWLLERRRLEITLRGFERKRQRRWSVASRLRPAIAVGLLLLALAAAGLCRDSDVFAGFGAAQDYLGAAPLVLKLSRLAGAG